MRFEILVIGLCLFGAAPSYAQIATKEPVSIEASNQLEWIQDQFIYRATGDVVITQGTTTIKADEAEAHYDAQEGPSSITTISAKGSVIMTNGAQTIYADSAEYDTRNTLLTLHGAPVRLVTDTQKVTANKTMTYDTTKHEARATGGATVEDGNRNLKADSISAWLSEDGKSLQRATATGRVVITHRAENSKQSNPDIAQSDSATYDAVKNTVDLKGNVKLTRDTTHMQGEAAHIDIATGHSTLKNNPASGGKEGGRVRAMFTPGDSNTPLPNINTAVPMVPGKRNPEMPYQVGSGKKIDHVQ